MEKFEKWNNVFNDWKTFRYDESVMIVIIKDIYTWIKSMCNNNYDFKYYTSEWELHCPKQVNETELEWIPESRGSMDNSITNTSNGYFPNMIKVWNLFYHQWISTIDQSKYPVLIVRFEDLLLRPVPLVKKLCRCFGYNELIDDDVFVPSAAAKDHSFMGVNFKSNDRLSAMEKYADPLYRFKDFEAYDLTFIDRHVNRTIMDIFNY